MAIRQWIQRSNAEYEASRLQPTLTTIPAAGSLNTQHPPKGLTSMRGFARTNWEHINDEQFGAPE